MKFTVIVPTRERCDTLGPALRTLVQQRYDNLDIIVSDNASSDRTAEVVRSFADRRIRYLNTGRRLAMSANWEFALSHVEEGYVTIIGDDDGLLPDAIPELARLVEEMDRPGLVGWTKTVYHWPNYFDPALRNVLTVPLATGLERHDSRTALAELMRFERPYAHLPGLYNAIADVRLVREVASRSGGTFFHSSSPDIYSAIVLTASVDSFFFSQRPFGIGGQSAHSTGSSHVNGDQQPQAFQRFMSEGNLPFHYELMMAPSLPILTAEAYLQVRDHYDGTLAAHDLPRTLEAALRTASVGSSASYRETRAAVRQVAERHGHAALAAQLERRHPHRQVDYEVQMGWNPLRGIIAVRADEFAAYDVYEASVLARHLLELYQRAYFAPAGVARTTLSAGVRSGLRRLRTLARSVASLRSLLAL